MQTDNVRLTIDVGDDDETSKRGESGGNQILGDNY